MQNLILLSKNDLLELVQQLTNNVYLTKKEAMEYIRDGQTSFAHRIASGELVEGIHYFKKPSGKILFRRDRLDAWVTERSNHGKPLQQTGHSVCSIIDEWAESTKVS